MTCIREITATWRQEEDRHVLISVDKVVENAVGSIRIRYEHDTLRGMICRDQEGTLYVGQPHPKDPAFSVTKSTYDERAFGEFWTLFLEGTMDYPV